MAMQLAGVDMNNPTFQRYLSKIHEIFEMLNERLGRTPYLGGEEFTAADTMAVFSLTTMREVNSNLPSIVQVDEIEVFSLIPLTLVHTHRPVQVHLHLDLPPENRQTSSLSKLSAKRRSRLGHRKIHPGSSAAAFRGLCHSQMMGVTRAEQSKYPLPTQ